MLQRGTYRIPVLVGMWLTMWLTVTIGVGLASGALAAASAKKQPAVIRLWNWNIHDKKYQQKMYKLFNEKHPDIKIEYSSISNTVYEQTLEAAFIAKEPPDLFLPTGKLSFSYLRSKDWIMPLNDVAASKAQLSEWMAKFPPQLRRFVEGKNVFDGKAYIVDIKGESGSPGFPLYYNKTLFNRAGIGNPPATFSELRRTAAKITQAGQGKYFGAVQGLRYRPGGWHQSLSMSLAHAAGARGQNGPWGPDMKDGKYHTNTPEFISAFQVWIDMRKDGSVFPGELMMEDEQAKMAFATDKAAMFFGGDWVVSNVLAYNPKADFDLVLPPTPDDGIRRGYYNVGMAGGAFGYVVSAFTKNPEAVWEVIKFLSSLEYQQGYVQGGYGISYLPEGNRPENFQVRQMYKFVEWAMGTKWRRIVPDLPPDAEKVWGYYPGIYPSYSDVLDNIYLGRSGFEALADLDNRLNAAHETAIKRAQEAGTRITKEDFIFPDWDPAKDYAAKKK